MAIVNANAKKRGGELDYARVLVLLMAFILAFCAILPSALADMVVDWNASLMPGSDNYGPSGTLSSVGNSADVSESTCFDCLPATSSVSLSISVPDTLALSVGADADHTGSQTDLQVGITETMELVANGLANGTLVRAVITSSLTGSLFDSAGDGSATSSAGSFSLSAQNFESLSQPLSVNNYQVMLVPANKPFSFGSALVLDASAGGGPEDGNANASATATLSFSVAAAPEPSSMLFLLCGLLVLAVGRRFVQGNRS